MPRFHFHVEDGPDELGIELPTIADAKVEAARYAGKLLTDAASSFWERADLNMWITDDTGLILFSLRVCGTDAPAIHVVPKIPA